MTNTHTVAAAENIRSETALEAVVTQSEHLMEALVAAYALMAHADGEVAGAERRRFFSIVRETPALAVFSRQEIVEEAAVHEANFGLDPELAQHLAREKLQPIASDRRAARLVVAACRELIPADGVAHPGEYRVLAEIKALLGLEDAPAPHPLSAESRRLRSALL